MGTPGGGHCISMGPTHVREWPKVANEPEVVENREKSGEIEKRSLRSGERAVKKEGKKRLDRCSSLMINDEDAHDTGVSVCTVWTSLVSTQNGTAGGVSSL